MKRLLGLVVIVMCVAGTAQAQFTNADVQGRYGFNLYAAYYSQYHVAGWFIADGDGSITDGEQWNIYGTLTFDGTYTVNPDGTGFVELTYFLSGEFVYTIMFNVVIVDNSRELRLVATSTSISTRPFMTGTARKQIDDVGFPQGADLSGQLADMTELLATMSEELRALREELAELKDALAAPTRRLRTTPSDLGRHRTSAER